MATDVGAIYRSSLTVRDATGALVNAATQVLTVTLPDQSTATPSVVTDGTGTYHSDYTIAQEGLHRFAWATTAPVFSQTDYENGRLYRSVVGLAEMKTFLNVLDTSRDSVLRGILMAATREAEKVVGTCVPKLITNERIPGYARAAMRLPSAPVLAGSTIAIASIWPGGPTWDQTMLSVSNETGVVEPLDYIGFWYGPWNATYTAGRTVIPSTVVLAVQEIVWDLWAQQRMIGADQLEPGLEETAQYEARMPAGYTMPAHAKAMLQGDAIPGFA